MTETSASISIVIPAKNEAASIGAVLKQLRALVPTAELVVVDDGSTDNTAGIANQHGARVVTHPTSRGNGAAVKSGLRAVSGEIVVCMDADGQHSPADVPRLLDRLAEGYDMVVGARMSGSQANWWRGLANRLYNRIASWMTGQPVDDLTSGFRAVRRARMLEFLPLLPNGFSYPTTSTMAFFRAGYGVSYVPIQAAKRTGRSHIRVGRDGVRFLLIIFRVGTLYSPLKIFFPLSLLLFTTGAGYVVWTLLADGRFTNFGTLLLVTSLLVFLIGLVSEQITSLLYASGERGSQR